MNIWMMMAVAGWAIVAMVIAAFVTLATARTWTRFSLIASILFLAGWAGGYAKYRYSATEAFRESSPDGRYDLIVYRLPSFGAFEEGAAIVRLCDKTGRRLHQVDVPFIGAADATWMDHEVMVGGHVWKLK